MVVVAGDLAVLIHQQRGVGLLSQVRSLLRPLSRRGVPGHARDVLHFDGLTLDLDTREVLRARRAIALTPTEFSVLELFLRHPRRVLTRSFIFTRVWGFDLHEMSNSLNVCVGNLRRKIEAGGEPRLIHTVRGVGYVLKHDS
jgi:two-component system response regulator MprA